MNQNFNTVNTDTTKLNYICILRKDCWVKFYVTNTPNTVTGLLVLGVTRYVEGQYGQLKESFPLKIKLCGVDVDESKPMQRFKHWVKIEIAIKMTTQRVIAYDAPPPSKDYVCIDDGWLQPDNMVAFATSAFDDGAIRRGNVRIMNAFNNGNVYEIPLTLPVEPVKYKGALYCAISEESNGEHYLVQFMEATDIHYVREYVGRPCEVVAIQARLLQAQRCILLSEKSLPVRKSLLEAVR